MYHAVSFARTRKNPFKLPVVTHTPSDIIALTLDFIHKEHDSLKSKANVYNKKENGMENETEIWIENTTLTWSVCLSGSYKDLLTIDEFNFRTHTKIKSEIVIEHYDLINKGRQENHKNRKWKRQRQTNGN